ncbi:MAG TPA: HAMP domain-containing sensor histidine kinase [Aliidongia sp.]|nr:HAMP domain-containing sensor histidine kinase [Aliidongia sp.]
MAAGMTKTTPSTVAPLKVRRLLESLENRNLASGDLGKARQAVSLARDCGDASLLVRALTCYSGVCQAAGAADEALAVAGEAVSVAVAGGDRVGEGVAHYRVAIALWHQRRLIEALSALERAEAIASETGNQHRQIRCQMMMGVMLGYLGNYPRCLATYDQAQALCDPVEHESEFLLLLCNKAQTLINRARASTDPAQVLRDADAAFEILSPAIIARAEQRLPSYYLAFRDTVGQSQILRGDPASAVDIFSENLRLIAGNGDEIGEATYRVGLAEAWLALDRPRDAVDICLDVIRNYSARLVPEDLARTRLTLSKGLRSLGRHEAALEEFIIFHEMERHGRSDVVEQYSRHMATILELEKSKAEAASFKELAGELGKAYAAAEAASRAKSEFFSNMSHELRTPLNAIIGFTEIMREQLFGEVLPRYLSYLDDIYGSGQHLLDLINQLLDFSKAEAGKLELVDETVDLDRMMHDVVMLLREVAHTGKVRLKAPRTSGLLIRVDPLRMKQCLINVLSNAIKFTEADGEISVSSHSDEDGAHITVADTGIGLEPEDLPRVFERFGQGGNARAGTGTGLGLPLTKQLIEQHGGTVELISTRGVGTTVTLHLPRERIVSSEDRVTTKTV